MTLPEYFTDKELACGCGCGLLPPQPLVRMLYTLRLLFNYKILTHSAARCHKYNKQIGGSPNSLHLPQDNVDEGIITGAFDISAKYVHHQHEHELIKHAMHVGFRGIGIKNNEFLHIDNRPNPAVWVY